MTGEKTIAVYGEDTDWGHSLGDNLVRYFSEAGYEVVYNEYFAAGTTDMYAILAKIQSSGANIVAGTINTPASAAAFLKQAREVGLESQIVCHSLNENADCILLSCSSLKPSPSNFSLVSFTLFLLPIIPR